MRALSIRQPYAEMILRGIKTEEYRSCRTRVRGRVFIYAGKLPGQLDFFRQLGVEPGDLPTGLLVGTVEIVDCTGSDKAFVWHLREPKRLFRPHRPLRMPQPMFFYPF